MAHVMIDLETMGTHYNAPIVAIGACVFTEDGLGETFYQPISLASAVEHGAEMDPNTVIWWMQQSDDARNEVILASGDMTEALAGFRRWIESLGELEGVWGNGASFDNVILTQAYRRQGENAPWPFFKDRCYRTVKSFSKVKMERVGTHHNAVDDALSQAAHLIRIWEDQANG